MANNLKPSDIALKDPLGIGVPYYGPSTFDPYQFTKEAWAGTVKKFKEESEEGIGKSLLGIQSYIKQLPTPEAWEQQTYKQLSDEALKISQDVYMEVIKKNFNPLGNSPYDLMKKAEFDKRMAEYKGKIDLYKSLKPLYDAQFKLISDPSNQEVIDKELTEKRVKDFIEEPDLSKKFAMLQDGLIVFKPKPVEVSTEMARALNMYLPGHEKIITKDAFDEETGLWKTEYLEKVDKKKLDSAMDKVWNVLSDRVRNEIQRRYEAAPVEEKTVVVDGEKIPLDVKDWFKKSYSPEFAERITAQYRRAPSKEENVFKWIFPQKNEQGEFILDERFKEWKEIGYSPDGVKEGTQLPVYAELVIPLQGAFKTMFQMPQVPSAFDAKTGVRLKPGSAYFLPDNISFLPVAKEDINYPFSNVIKKIRKGEIIPSDLMTQLREWGLIDKYEYKPYLFSLTTNRMIQGEVPDIIKEAGLEDVSGVKTVSMANTTVSPWEDVAKYLKAHLAGKNINFKELDEFIEEAMRQLNSVTYNKKTFDIFDVVKNEM